MKLKGYTYCLKAIGQGRTESSMEAVKEYVLDKAGYNLMIKR